MTNLSQISTRRPQWSAASPTRHTQAQIIIEAVVSTVREDSILWLDNIKKHFEYMEPFF